jgi:hypothetical protein
MPESSSGADTFMNTLRIPQNRLRWKHAALCSFIVMLLSLAALFGARLLASRGAGPKTGATASRTNADDAAIRSLSNKIVADDQREDTLQSEQAKLSELARSVPAPVTVSQTDRVRHELAEKFVDLLVLEKHAPESNAEIVEVRQQINRLQARFATMPLSVGREQKQVSAAASDLQKQLTAIENELSANEAQTNSDVMRLGQLVRANETKISPTVEHPALNSWAIFSTSLLLALIAGTAVFMTSGYVTTVVGDEMFLRELLPSTVEVAGTVQHMRMS